MSNRKNKHNYKDDQSDAEEESQAQSTSNKTQRGRQMASKSYEEYQRNGSEDRLPQSTSLDTVSKQNLFQRLIRKKPSKTQIKETENDFKPQKRKHTENTHQDPEYQDQIPLTPIRTNLQRPNPKKVNYKGVNLLPFPPLNVDRSEEELSRYNGGEADEREYYAPTGQSAQRSRKDHPTILITHNKDEQNNQEKTPPKREKNFITPSKDYSPLVYKSMNLEAQQQQRTKLPPGTSNYFGPVKVAPNYSDEFKHVTYKSQKIKDQQRDMTPLPPKAAKYFSQQPKSTRTSAEIDFDLLYNNEDFLSEELSDSEDDQQLNLTIRDMTFFEYIWNMAIAILRMFNILR